MKRGSRLETDVLIQAIAITARPLRNLEIVIPPRAGPGAQPAIPAAGGDKGCNIINRNLPYREAPPCGRELPIFRPCASQLKLQRRNSRFALRQSSLRALRCGGRGPRKISNMRFKGSRFPSSVHLDKCNKEEYGPFRLGWSGFSRKDHVKLRGEREPDGSFFWVQNRWENGPPSCRKRRVLTGPAGRISGAIHHREKIQ